jgi:hypothetical protein
MGLAWWEADVMICRALDVADIVKTSYALKVRLSDNENANETNGRPPFTFFKLDVTVEVVL